MRTVKISYFTTIQIFEYDFPYATANILKRHIERSAGIYLDIFYVTMSVGGTKFNTGTVIIFEERQNGTEESKVKLITTSHFLKAESFEN